MKIKILKRHILKGEPSSKTKCPIALAIKEKTKLDVLVFDNRIELKVPVTHKLYHRWKTFWLPICATSFINQFDETDIRYIRQVEPIEFDMDLPKLLI